MPTPPDAELQRWSILLVDDQPGNLDLLRKYLQREEYLLSAATSGEMALRIAAKLKPDLILLDVMMPGLDGYQTCTALKSDAALAPIPVVFVTAKTQPEDIDRGFGVGAADYIAKPVQQLELLVRVKNQLALKQARDLQQRNLIEQTRLASLGRLLSEFSHELSTPLGCARLAVSSLSERLPEIRHGIEQHTLTVSAMHQLLAMLDETCRVSGASLELASALVQSFKSVAVDQCAQERYRFLLRDYLDKVALSLRHRLKHRRIELQIQGDAALELDSYPGAFAQILCNLIENSLTHGFGPRDAGRIDIDFSRDGERLQLRYRDNGRGIDPADLPRIFEPYFTTRRGQGGSGLGMSIVRQLVDEQLGGRIECSSAPGQGVCFSFSLPL